MRCREEVEEFRDVNLRRHITTHLKHTVATRVLSKCYEFKPIVCGFKLLPSGLDRLYVGRHLIKVLQLWVW